jgi:hypothetical protein
MKKETMKRLLALPKESQDKVWKLALDRLELERKQKNNELHPVAKQAKK